MSRSTILLATVTALAGCSGGADKLRALTWARDRLFTTRSQRAAKAFDLEDADRRREGIADLSSRKWGLQVPYLKAYSLLAQDPDDPTVRCAAINALGRAGDAKYLPVLVDALSDPVPMVRMDAAEALETVRGEEAVEPLGHHASWRNEPDPDVRVRCVRTLRHYRRRDVLDVLVACLWDKDFGVRHAARGALREMTGQDGDYDAGRWRGLLAGTEDMFGPPPEK